jgi:drug/metabolite transporter (DMT)-like permease
MMENKATGILFAVAVLWALTFPLIGGSLSQEDPFLFVALRFSLAALILLPVFLKNMTKEVLIVGLMLGLLNSGSYISQTIGLKLVNSSRAAFVVGTYVIFIPFIAPLFKLQRLSKMDCLSALICTIGLYILTGANLSEVTYGDGILLLCAFFVALSITYVAQLSKKNFDPIGLASSQIFFTACFSWIVFLLLGNWNLQLRPEFLYILFYCSICSTILTFFLQIKYQKYVPTQKVALIFCLEPVFVTVFDVLINQATIRPNMIAGGSLILCSILILELRKSIAPAKI